MLTAPELGELLGHFPLLTVDERPGLELQGGIAGMDRPVMDGLGMSRLDLVGRGCVIRLALDDQVVQGSVERPAGLVKASP